MNTDTAIETIAESERGRKEALEKVEELLAYMMTLKPTKVTAKQDRRRRTKVMKLEDELKRERQINRELRALVKKYKGKV